MSNGLKNLQSAARAASRRDRLETGASLAGYDDDSGISGIGLTPVDDLDASYSSPETSSSCAHSFSSSSVASSGYHHHLQAPHTATAALLQQQQSQHHHHPHHHPHHPHHHQAQHQHQGSYGMGTAAYYGHGYSPSASSTASMSHQGYAPPRGNQDGSSPYLDAQRLSASDMGIDAIVNRPGGGRA